MVITPRPYNYSDTVLNVSAKTPAAAPDKAKPDPDLDPKPGPHITAGIYLKNRTLQVCD